MQSNLRWSKYLAGRALDPHLALRKKILPGKWNMQTRRHEKNCQPSKRHSPTELCALWWQRTCQRDT